MSTMSSAAAGRAITRTIATSSGWPSNFNAIHLIGNQVCAPIELPANSRHLDTYRANLLYSDQVFHCSAIGSGRAVDGIRMMAIARDLDSEQMTASPGVITIISVNSPRRFDEAMSDGLIAMPRQ